MPTSPKPDLQVIEGYTCLHCALREPISQWLESVGTTCISNVINDLTQTLAEMMVKSDSLTSEQETQELITLVGERLAYWLAFYFMERGLLHPPTGQGAVLS